MLRRSRIDVKSRKALAIYRAHVVWLTVAYFQTVVHSLLLVICCKLSLDFISVCGCIENLLVDFKTELESQIKWLHRRQIRPWFWSSVEYLLFFLRSEIKAVSDLFVFLSLELSLKQWKMWNSNINMEGFMFVMLWQAFAAVRICSSLPAGLFAAPLGSDQSMGWVTAEKSFILLSVRLMGCQSVLWSSIHSVFAAFI